MAVGIPEEILVALERLIQQATDESNDTISRLDCSLKTSIYLEAVTRALVEQARAEGKTWEDLGEVFGTSAINIKARFGSYRSYEDDEDDDDDAGAAEAVGGSGSPPA